MAWLQISVLLLKLVWRFIRDLSKFRRKWMPQISGTNLKVWHLTKRLACKESRLDSPIKVTSQRSSKKQGHPQTASRLPCFCQQTPITAQRSLWLNYQVCHTLSLYRDPSLKAQPWKDQIDARRLHKSWPRASWRPVLNPDKSSQSGENYLEWTKLPARFNSISFHRSSRKC